MTERRPDELLWELPKVEIDDGPAPPDDRLHAYRQGGLDLAEQARLEWDLAGSRRGRARLAELAGIDLATRPAIPIPTRRPWRIAAAALAAAASIVLAVWIALPPDAPPLPAFDVRVQGLAADRGAVTTAEAHVDTLVRVTVEATASSLPSVRFFAYRRDASALTLLTEPGDLAVVADRGNAVITARAVSLVGPGSGTRTFYVVVAPTSDLPSSIGLDAREDAHAALERASKGRVYPINLTILEPTDGAR